MLRKDRAHHLFPVIALALVGALTTWLDRIAQPLPGDPGQAAASAATMRVESFTMRRFDAQGIQQYTFSAEAMRHFEAPERTEIDQPRLVFLGREAPVRASALRGTVSANGESVELTGEVKVVRAATATRGAALLSTEALTLWPDTERVAGDRPVSYLEGRSEVHAGRFVADNLDLTLQLAGGVTATFVDSR